MIVTDEMVEAGLVAFLKAMGIDHAPAEYDAGMQRLWRKQVRATLEAALTSAQGKA